MSARVDFESANRLMVATRRRSSLLGTLSPARRDHRGSEPDLTIWDNRLASRSRAGLRS
jgi:hypothetical protein